MKKIYIFSGLGADKRVFKYLDFSGFDITFIEWITPENKESIGYYAKRLTEQIHTDNPILIGLSFGGIIAGEVAKHIQTEKIILIASAKSYKEIPFYYRWLGALKVHKLVPTSLMKQSNFFSYWLFGIKTNEDKKLLTEILNDTDPRLLKWAINAIVNWKNIIEPQKYIHIHGSSDKILPLRFVNAAIIIEDGGHFMTINKPEELNQIIKQSLLNS
ncbi:pimeloyl-ACP methyl ester carboxylesterase [Flavobacterium arsenatis]|uniref:Pimeloyl-ACP methyl ester carboxylesterase n=1 Tax=Flavobacterium arsenatis TaxID=1484332 RepID=A0ABU1TKR7_9FLAO|nr:alpha/beta hydrolase [Flavobacterium arsenatis]MDR6966572.1 pimeloyl-ACP methyl ester carboxylesterase [Flavobacterium arsenatis]